MRWIVAIVSMVVIGGFAPMAQAGEDKERTQQVLGGVISGLLGGSSQSPDAAYTAKEQGKQEVFLVVSTNWLAGSRRNASEAHANPFDR